MSTSTLTAPHRAFAITGRHVLGAFISFFGIIFAVNGVLIYKALKTHTGLVAQEPYRKGLQYNDRIEADERQHQLGWSDEVGLDPAGTISVVLTDSAKKPVEGLAVSAVLGRPSTAGYDHSLRLQETAPGRYVAAAGALATGAWLANIEVKVPATGEAAKLQEPIYRIKRRLWLKP